MKHKIFIDFLRLPRPQGGAKNRIPINRDELGAAKINLLPPGAGVNKLIFKRFIILCS